jgi:hypothetical protein
MPTNRAITIKFVTFRSTFVYDCTALVPPGMHSNNNSPFYSCTGYVQRTIGEVAA